MSQGRPERNLSHVYFQDLLQGIPGWLATYGTPGKYDWQGSARYPCNDVSLHPQDVVPGDLEPCSSVQGTTMFVKVGVFYISPERSITNMNMNISALASHHSFNTFH